MWCVQTVRKEVSVSRRPRWVIRREVVVVVDGGGFAIAETVLILVN
jgi:hypothetical protein